MISFQFNEAAIIGILGEYTQYLVQKILDEISRIYS